ncbi:MAG: hypothetical protein SH857_10020 [Chitinophagales bacterium]|nr:hypothetical protein [Chitinophagales bacterium]
MSETNNSNADNKNPISERSDNIEKNLSKNGGGDGDKKKGGDASSSRWGQENLSTKDCGQNPDKLRSLGERELSEFDNNTTTVGQPGNRKSLTLIDREEDKLT